MNSEDESLQRDREVLTAIDEALEKGHWKKSLFLTAIEKKIKAIRDRVVSRIQILSPTDEKPSSTEATVTLSKAGQKEVFISLYCTEGANIQNWERLLASLGNQIVTRPTYSKEDDARTGLRSKTNKQNEAYIVAIIKDVNILEIPKDKTPRDRLGQELLLLKDNAVTQKNITRFVHQSGEYILREQHLIRQGDVEFSDFI